MVVLVSPGCLQARCLLRLEPLPGLAQPQGSLFRTRQREPGIQAAEWQQGRSPR